MGVSSIQAKQRCLRWIKRVVPSFYVSLLNPLRPCDRIRFDRKSVVDRIDLRAIQFGRTIVTKLTVFFSFLSFGRSRLKKINMLSVDCYLQIMDPSRIIQIIIPCNWLVIPYKKSSCLRQCAMSKRTKMKRHQHPNDIPTKTCTKITVLLDRITKRGEHKKSNQKCDLSSYSDIYQRLIGQYENNFNQN